MAIPLALALGGGAALGGIASMFGPRQVRSPFEQQMLQGMGQSIQGFQNLISAGPGAQDVAAGVGATRDFASLLQNLQASGGVPGSADIMSGRNFASRLFAAREEQLRQSFEDQLIQANRAAAMSGRGQNDPILRARLAIDQTRQQNLLAAERMGAEAQYAEQALGRRVGFAGQRAEALMGLGNQAFANQQNLFGMQQGLFGASLQTRRTQANPFGSFLQGALGGASAGLGIAQGFQGLDMMAAQTANTAANTALMNQQAKAIGRMQFAPQNSAPQSFAPTGSDTAAPSLYNTMLGPANNPALVGQASGLGGQRFSWWGAEKARMGGF